MGRILVLKERLLSAGRQSLAWFKGLRRRWQVLLVASFIALVAYVFCLPRQLFHTPYATVVADRHNELLGARIAADGQWRFPPSDTVPDKFQECILAFEDRYFYYHWGVNPLAIGRAIKQNIQQKRTVSGGSTLTMQTIRLARNQPRTLSEKCIEAIWATRLEFRYSKEKILALYASHAPFGGNVVGLEAASWRYFGHGSDKLSWAEAATLAVLPNAPSMLHLSKNRDALVKKRNRLLKKLADKGTLSASDYELALTEALPDEPLPLPQIAPHWVTRFHQYNKGKYIVSSVDKNLQQQVEQIISRWNGELKRSDIRNIAALVIDVTNSEVLAYCGNVNFESKASGNQVDVIQSPRSTGSILKPFLYCAMLQEGEILPHTLLPDIPVNINGFTPQNFNLQYDGAVPASEALARSLNIPTVQMLRTYSVPKFYHFLKSLGISTLNRPASHYGLSLILGGAEATLWDVSESYYKLASHLSGQDEEEIHYSIDENDIYLPERNRLAAQYPLRLNRAAIYQTLQAITEVNRPEEIDWHSIPSMQTIAWKTGTSYGFRDAWAVGLTPRYVVGVWVGNANGEGKPGLTGARTAGPVMFDIFNLLPASRWFEPPLEEMVEVEVCKKSGHMSCPYCEEIDTLLICPAGLKSLTCPYHIEVNVTEDESYRVYENCVGNAGIVRKNWFVLPPAWEWYYKQHNPSYRPLPPFMPDCGSDGNYLPMQFIYPQSNARVFLPKQMDGSKGEIIFDLAHSHNDAVVYWHLDDKYVGTTRTFHKMGMSPTSGKHSVTVVDNEGNTLSIGVEVEAR